MVVTTMQALLDRFAMTEGEVAEAVAEQLAGVAATGTAELSSTDVGVLSDAGLVIGPDAVAAGRRARTATLADQISLLMGPSAAQVAQAAGVCESRVRHWASGGALVAIRVGRGMRFPRFQFNVDGHPLSGHRWAVLFARSHQASRGGASTRAPATTSCRGTNFGI